MIVFLGFFDPVPRVFGSLYSLKLPLLIFLLFSHLLDRLHVFMPKRRD